MRFLFSWLAVALGAGHFIGHGRAPAAGVLRNVGLHFDGLQVLNELLRVIGLVGAQRHLAVFGRCLHGIADHRLGRCAFSISIGLGDARIGNQAVTVVGRAVADVAQLGSGVAFAVQPCITVGGALMGVVAALLAFEVAAIAGAAIVILGLEALVARPGLDQGAVNAEVLAREQAGAVGDLGAARTGTGGGIGTWTSVNESMPARAAAYQSQITGQSGQAYVVNGVKFDGYANGALLEAKGPGYSAFVNGSGEFKPWFNGQQSLLNQAYNQLEAANGIPIVWHVAEPSAATAIRNLLQSNGFGNIRIVNTAPK